MKKLYIPTSTFNFNNILSSESISPKAFYEHRRFGYSRWLEIPENHIENVILLYDKPVGFSRPSSDIEDHPLLIEICIEEEFPQSVQGVFYSDHTIYLSPWRTRFIFFSEQDKRITLSLSDSSLETKLIRLYQKGFCVEKPAMIKFPKIELNVGLNQEKIEYDYRVNKLKGLLYGYYIGALLSSTPEVIRTVNLLQELQDIFFSVLSTEDRSFTTFQKERVNLVFAELQEDLKIQIRKARKRLEPFAEEIIVTDKSLNKISNVHLNENREECLAIAWINEVLLLKNYNGKISSFKEKISDEVTTKAKEIYKEDWEGSSAKSLLNQMRKYVRGQENTFQWNNLLISSMTAVIAKGDDWEQLLTFMQSKYMFDYRLAFAFWGELNGFANLTRDFTDNFFTIDDRNYVADVYKELYGQLLGIDPVLSNGRPIIIEKEVPIQEVNQSYEKEIEDIIRNCGCKISKKDLTIYKEICNHTKGINEKFLKEIKDDKRINKGKGPQKKVENCFWEKVYPVRSRNLKNRDVSNNLLFPQETKEELPMLKSLEKLCSSNMKIKKRLNDNWDYTIKINGYMNDEQIKHFVNLCKKESNGVLKNKLLLGLFDEDLAEQVKRELMEFNSKS